eukprot:scaffold1769_cov132-Skeletonema_dohrnii-CCMP3373.AAC.26
MGLKNDPLNIACRLSNPFLALSWQGGNLSVVVALNERLGIGTAKYILPPRTLQLSISRGHLFTEIMIPHLFHPFSRWKLMAAANYTPRRCDFNSSMISVFLPKRQGPASLKAL